MRVWTRKVLCGVNRSVGRWLPAGVLARTIAGIPGRVHVDDQMFRSEAPEHVCHYVEDAQSAIENLRASLEAAGRSFGEVTACLDFGCGYGRVTRWLARTLSPERVTAADVDRQGVRFCADEFGVGPLLVNHPTAQNRFTDHYDLIFAGSVLTHLPLPECAETLDALTDLLGPAGVLVFSTQGASCLAHLDWYGEEFAWRKEEFHAGCDTSGGQFVPYRHRRAYGITILTRRWVERLMEDRFGDVLRFVRFAERGWDSHQDVWSYQRVAR